VHIRPAWYRRLNRKRPAAFESRRDRASAPTIPPAPTANPSVAFAAFPGASVCEWKGTAKYWSLKTSEPAREAISWSYPTAQSPYELISGYFSFYPRRVECFVDNQRVRPQPGYFYGGWITDEIVGPWKGAPGTESW